MCSSQDADKTIVCLTGSFLITFSIYFDNKTGLFPFQNNLKNLDLSCKTDIDCWDCFRKENLMAEIIILEMEKPCFITLISMAVL